MLYTMPEPPGMLPSRLQQLQNEAKMDGTPADPAIRPAYGELSAPILSTISG